VRDKKERGDRQREREKEREREDKSVVNVGKPLREREGEERNGV